MSSTIYLLIAFIGLGVLIHILRKYTGRNARKQAQAEEQPQSIMKTRQQGTVRQSVADGECCGAHEFCEKTGKYNPQFKPDYYDDEELDAYKGVNPDNYTEDQIAEFDDVLMTMNEKDVAGWLKSLTLRGIEPPYSVREKAFLIIEGE